MSFKYDLFCSVIKDDPISIKDIHSKKDELPRSKLRGIQKRHRSGTLLTKLTYFFFAPPKKRGHAAFLNILLCCLILCYSPVSRLATAITSSESQYPLCRNSSISEPTFSTNPFSFASSKSPIRPVVGIFNLSATCLPARSSSNIGRPLKKALFLIASEAKQSRFYREINEIAALSAWGELLAMTRNLIFKDLLKSALITRHYRQGTMMSRKSSY